MRFVTITADRFARQVAAPAAESGWPLRRQRRVPRAGTTTIPALRPVVAKDTVPDHGWKVVLHNDDVTELDVVIFALQRAAGLVGHQGKFGGTACQTCVADFLGNVIFVDEGLLRHTALAFDFGH